MENEEQIKEYIENKEKDWVAWALDTITTEFNSMIWREEKETKDSLNVLNWFKNDKDLYDYAELKLKDDSELHLKDQLNIIKLELKLSLKCSYFKDFQKFLEELKNWDDVSWNPDQNTSITPELAYDNNYWNQDEQMNREQMKWNPRQTIEWSVISEWWNKEERIPSGKVQEVWNYISNWWTFYSPSKWTVERWKWKYKHVCSTGSYNVLWKLWFPKISNSLNCDLDWTILPKMWLEYICEVDPNNPGKNWYKPQDGDTAVWPRFTRDSWTKTQHQATYINGSWVSDTIQEKMSCYWDKNEPMCKIYRYHCESREKPSWKVVDYALKNAKMIASNNEYWYKLWWKGWNNWYDCCGLVCSVYREAFKKAWLKEDKISFTNCYHMKDVFKKAWFKRISPYDRSKLKPWDIMLDEDKHTEIYAWNWQTIWAHRDIDWKSWDSSWNEISLTDKNWMWKYFLDTYHKQYGWDWILRYEW